MFEIYGDEARLCSLGEGRRPGDVESRYAARERRRSHVARYTRLVRPFVRSFVGEPLVRRLAPSYRDAGALRTFARSAAVRIAFARRTSVRFVRRRGDLEA